MLMVIVNCQLENSAFEVNDVWGKKTVTNDVVISISRQGTVENCLFEFKLFFPDFTVSSQSPKTARARLMGQ